MKREHFSLDGSFTHDRERKVSHGKFPFASLLRRKTIPFVRGKRQRQPEQTSGEHGHDGHHGLQVKINDPLQQRVHGRTGRQPWEVQWTSLLGFVCDVSCGTLVLMGNVCFYVVWWFWMMIGRKIWFGWKKEEERPGLSQGAAAERCLFPLVVFRAAGCSLKAGSGTFSPLFFVCFYLEERD